MALYMTQFAYTPEAWTAFTKNPRRPDGGHSGAGAETWMSVRGTLLLVR